MKKIFLAFAAIAAMGMTSCIDDKGNYDYEELATITIDGLPDLVQVLDGVEYIDVTPTITSSIEGVISENDPNFKFQYRIGYASYGLMGGQEYDEDFTNFVYHPWVDITPSSGYHLHQLAEWGSGAYIIWFTVTDTRNNTTTGKVFNVNASLTTSEGWLVLGNDAKDNTTRLDMISKINDTRIECLYGVARNMPTVHNATGIAFVAKQSNPGDVVGVLSPEGSYYLNNETLESDGTTYNEALFAIDPGEELVREYAFTASTWDWMCKYNFGVTASGNCYRQLSSIYGLALNTLKDGEDPQFKVAPYVTFNVTQPYATSYGENAMFFDVTNERFLIFDGKKGLNQLYTIAEPDAPLFTYNNTGKKAIYAESTRRSNGLCYWILEAPNGDRSICMINMGGGSLAQEGYIEKVDAPEFNQATTFAFHSRFPLMFYSAGTKLYCYNLATQSTTEVATGFGANEEITFIKFNLYRNPTLTSLLDQSEKFMEQQYRLVVCSYDNSAATDGGKVTLFDVDGTGSTATASTDTWSGFKKIVDIVYREQHE